jgi:glycosyltransferase involved in cell wall biosynthesis
VAPPDGARYGDAIPTAALLSFRLGGTDGVAVEAAKWQGALVQLGYDTVTVAGDGPVDRLLPGLAIGAVEPPHRSDLEAALADADLVVVENLCSLPLNPEAASVVADVLAGRPAVLHHHDLPWQRAIFTDHPPPPVDPRWAQVTINELSRGQLARRGITATTIYNAFAVERPGPGPGTDPPEVLARREQVRRALGVGRGQRLVLQPTRAIPRKNVAGGIRAATELGATYWLLGPAEDGYWPELDALVAAARCPVVLGPPDMVPGVGIHDAYHACDVVALPSTWEGFGNPTIESVIHRRPLVVGPYPVATELAAFGFEWFGLDQTDRLAAWLDAPDVSLLDHNQRVAADHFSLHDLPRRIATVLPAR